MTRTLVVPAVVTLYVCSATLAHRHTSIAIATTLKSHHQTAGCGSNKHAICVRIRSISRLLPQLGGDPGESQHHIIGWPSALAGRVVKRDGTNLKIMVGRCLPSRVS